MNITISYANVDAEFVAELLTRIPAVSDMGIHTWDDPTVEVLRRSPNPEDVLDDHGVTWQDVVETLAPIKTGADEITFLGWKSEGLQDPRTPAGREVVKRAACSYCGQDKRHPCTTPTGASAQFTHVDRIRAAIGESS